MTSSSNNTTLIKEAQAARVNAHIRAMLSKLKARTQKREEQSKSWAA
jgi:hypothetical protein